MASQLIASFLFLPVSVSAYTPDATPAPTEASEVGTGYDDYLLATQKVGESIAGGITKGVENTAQLYRSAWNELASLAQQGPTLSLPKVGPTITSYTQFSNSLGETFTQTLIAGTGASQDLSQKIWSTDPYGHLTANVSDTWESVTTYFGNLFKKTPAPAQPLPTSTQGGVGTPAVNVGAKPVTPKPTPTPVIPKLPTPAKSGVGTPTSDASVGAGASVGVQSTQIITQRVLSGVTSADLELKMQQLRNELVSKIGQVAGQSQSNYSNNFAAIALTNKIDQLTNTVLTTPTITGGSITNTSISGGTISGSTISGAISVSSGTFSGSLTVQGTGTSTFTGGIETNLLNVTSSTASSTFANGINLSAGCFSINGTCVGGSGGSGTPGGSSGQIQFNSSGSFGGASGFVWDSSNARVGIGTTSPYAKLSVVGEAVAANFTATSTTATTTLNGGLAVGTGASPSGLVYDHSTGFVGIGTAAPQAKLHVRTGTDDNLWFRSISDFGGDYVGTDGVGLQVLSDSLNGRNFSILGNTVDLSTQSGVANFRVASTGNVGIGTTSPWRKLSVTGTVGFDGLTTSVTGNAVCITTNKEITDAGAASCVPSSVRFKENITELPVGTALDELRKMTVKTFTYKKEYQMDTQEHIGLIAEDLETIDPRLVVYNTTDGKPWSIHFEEVTGLLVQAAQELDMRISALEANAGIIKDVTSGWSIDANGKLSVEELEVKGNVKIGSSDRRSGVTLYDEQTGAPYCLTISEGITKTTSGECGSVIAPQPQISPPPPVIPNTTAGELSTTTLEITTSEQPQPTTGDITPTTTPPTIDPTPPPIVSTTIDQTTATSTSQ